ncbi:MAG: homoserine O-succinyltransferase, partial [Clostridia bacterium]|nr:homoserine O-succinyltransferase [Clostridia bacterium]
GRQFFVMGHCEYDALTLDAEYRRDIEAGLDTDVPENYYKNNDPETFPIVTWRAHGSLLFTNWLNYFVYQSTPYDLKTMKEKK